MGCVFSGTGESRVAASAEPKRAGPVSSQSTEYDLNMAAQSNSMLEQLRTIADSALLVSTMQFLSGADLLHLAEISKPFSRFFSDRYAIVLEHACSGSGLSLDMNSGIADAHM